MQEKYFLSMSFGLLGVAFPFFGQAATLSDYPVYTGESASEYSGYNVSPAGDVNGDGYNDFIIGAYNKSDAGSGAGAAYLVYGSATEPTSPVNLGSTSNAVEFSGQTAGDYAGYSVAGGGDVNGDGYDDLLVGAYGYDNSTQTDAGRVYLIYGSSTPLTSQTLGATGQVVFTAVNLNSYLGRSVSFAGDINHDGYEDMVFGADGYFVSSGNDGAVFVVYGSATTLTSKNITDSSIIQLSGESGASYAGWSVASAGDVNGDTYDDFLVGAYGYVGSAGPSAGAAYLVYGQAATLSSASLSTHVRFVGESSAIQLGYAVNKAGDVNGDSYGDILIGAPVSSAGATNAGAVYLVYGNITNHSSITLTSSNSARLVSAVSGEAAGMSVATTGDLNGDGYDEFFIGAPSNDTAASNAGLIYFIQGSATQYTSTDLTTLLSSSAVSISGATIGDNAGQSIAPIGDRDNNGVMDVIIGAYGLNVTTFDEGGTYLLSPFLDEDGDGKTAAGSLLGSTDCNDADATVSTAQTYYQDSDGDGEGNPDVTTSVCSSTAPDGYANNSTDTDDTIANNGVEISGNDRDDDDDGIIDEVNTLAENGIHPGYGSVDPTDKDAFLANIQSITAKKKGRILVKYTDDAIFRYNIYPNFTGDKKVVVKSYRNRALVNVLQPKGTKIKLVNAYNGEKLSTKVLSQNKTYAKSSIKNLDVRHDGVIEVVVTSKKKSSVRVSVIKVNMNAQTLNLYDTAPVTVAGVVPKKTKAPKKKIVLKNSDGEIVLTFFVTKAYILQQI